MFSIDLLSQGIASILAVVVAAVWYHPKVLGKYITFGTNKISKPLSLVILFVLAFMVTFGLKHTIINIHAAFESVSAHPFSHGVLHGFLIAVFYGVVPTVAALVVVTQKKWIELFIHCAYWLIAISLMGGIIGLLG